MTLALGVALALACALITNVAFLCKHRGACAAPTVDVRRPLRSARGLLRSRWFALGMALAAAAWLLHVAALALAPLSVVQAVLAAGLVLLGVMAERLFGVPVGARQRLGTLLSGAGLVLLMITLPRAAGASSSFSIPAMVSFEAGLVAIGGLLVVGHRLGVGVERHGVMLGAASGLLFGVSDIAIKALTGLVTDPAPSGLAPWMTVAGLASVAAFYASAAGLQRGEAVPVIAATALAANVAAIAGGLIVFGDPLPRGTLAVVAQLLAFGLVCCAALLIPAPLRTLRAPQRA